MQIHQIQLKKRKPCKRVGRGGKRGTYCGKGMNGQKARSGAKVDPLFEGGRSTLIDRMKKLRGFKSLNAKKITFKLSEIDKKYQAGETVSIVSLIGKKMLSKLESKQGVKILGDGKLTKKIAFDKSILLSKTAEKSIDSRIKK